MQTCGYLESLLVYQRCQSNDFNFCCRAFITNLEAVHSRNIKVPFSSAPYLTISKDLVGTGTSPLGELTVVGKNSSLPGAFIDREFGRKTSGSFVLMHGVRKIC